MPGHMKISIGEGVTKSPPQNHLDAEILASERLQDICDEALWTEFFYFFAYDPQIGRAVSIHVGRDLSDLPLWRASLIAYLPGSELLVTMAQGRQVSPFRLELGPLIVECVEPGQLWSLHFDGLVDKVDRSANMRREHVGGETVPLAFAIDLHGAAPCWNLKSSIGDAQTYSRMHIQQISQATGRFSVGGVAQSFTGMGVRDHSSGPRDYGLVEGDFWISALFPSGRAIMAQAVALSNSHTNAGYISASRDAALEMISVTDHPMVPSRTMPPGSIPADPLDDPAARRFTLVVKTAAGAETLTGELLHSGAASFLPPAGEALGTLAGRADALQWTESLLRIEWNGETGFGVRERIAPMPQLDLSGDAA